MNNKPPYRKWVGVLLGLLLNGSAHFISGNRVAGLKWYLGISAVSIPAILIIAIPGLATYCIALFLLLIAFSLWIMMMKQSYRPVPRIGFLGWLVIIGIGITLTLVLRGTLHTALQAFRVTASSMSPTLQPGDRLFMEKVSLKFRQPGRGEIVVFNTDGIPSLPQHTFFVKRVAGLPGDRIRIAPPNLIVNNQAIKVPPIFHRISSAEPPFKGFQLATGYSSLSMFLNNTTNEVVLGQNEFLVLGDNTFNSYDSRYWGPVPAKNIMGRATRIYWPLSRITQSLGSD